MKHALRALLLISVVVASPLAFAEAARTPAPALSAKGYPPHWSDQEAHYYVTLEYGKSLESQLPLQSLRDAESSSAMVAGTNPLAVHAGLKVLERGGDAADAALTTSLTQIALSAGAAISYAGILTAAYYDSASRTVYSLNAGYNTIVAENDPLSIPGWGQHSGRTALVPGFMAGVQALHDRFGKRPFHELFARPSGLPIRACHSVL